MVYDAQFHRRSERSIDVRGFNTILREVSQKQNTEQSVTFDVFDRCSAAALESTKVFLCPLRLLENFRKAWQMQIGLRRFDSILMQNALLGYLRFFSV